MWYFSYNAWEKVCVSVCVRVYVCVCVYVYMYICMYVCVCMCMYVCVWYVCVCMYVCVYVKGIVSCNVLVVSLLIELSTYLFIHNMT